MVLKLHNLLGSQDFRDQENIKQAILALKPDISSKMGDATQKKVVAAIL